MSLPNKIKMYKICTSNVICDSGETVAGATGGNVLKCTFNQHCKQSLVKLIFTIGRYM